MSSLLQKFDLEIRNRKDTKNQAVDLLSWLENNDGANNSTLISEYFPDELFAISHVKVPWCAILLTILLATLCIVIQSKEEFLHDVKSYV